MKAFPISFVLTSSHLPTNEDGVEEDGIGRTSGRSPRMIMAHAITKDELLVTEGADGFLFPNFFFFFLRAW